MTQSMNSSPPPPTYSSESDFCSLPATGSRSSSPVQDTSTSAPRAQTPPRSPPFGPSETQLNISPPPDRTTDQHTLPFPETPRLSYESVSGTPTSTDITALDIRPPPTRRQRLLSHSSIKSNPTNHVALSRKSTPHRRFFSLYRTSASIKGSFIIKPFLHIPAALLAPLGPREDRKNLKLDVENGGIDVDIYLLDDPSLANEGHKTPRTTLDLKIRGAPSLNAFPLIAKIHTPTLLGAPFHLIATGIDGYLSLHLPRSFHGLLTVKVTAGNLDSHITTSHDLSDNLSILSETSTTRSYFVGELGGWAKGEQGWIGDQVDVGVNSGKIRVQFVGEKDLDILRRVCWRVVGL